VITRHGCDGAVLFVSAAAEQLFGCGVSDLEGQGLFGRVHVADRPAYLTALGDAAALSENRSVEFRVRRECSGAERRPAGQFVWIEMRCRPLEQAGAPDGREVVAVLRDVTERKRQEQALEEARAETERANASKSRFLATMSHELRTPLNAIIGFSDMLKHESTLMLDAGRRNEYAGLISDSGQRLLAVINGVLDISKIETDNFAITPEPFAPASVITAVCDTLALQANEAGIALERMPIGALPEIIADKRALNQILLNLLSNAIRFTDRRGKVTIGGRAEAGGITFVVEDNGVGINDEDLARVGEPYFQASATYDRRHGGTGLGLSIVKGLIRLHGGEIDIRSRLGAGTRVSVRLPLDCENAQLTQLQAARVPPGVIHYLTAPEPNDRLADDVSSIDIRVKKSA
jgi:cell cycle sensor histidine kinase DivJ